MREHSEQTRARGKKNVLWGAIWCIGGTIVTVVTYSIASGGGTYIVAWGAIIFGAIQLIMGLLQLQDAKLPLTPSKGNKMDEGDSVNCCTQCNERLSQGMVYCPQCGAKVST